MVVLFIGDVFGRSGRELAASKIPELTVKYSADFCIVNGENACHGRGLSMENADELLEAGADLITLGNHAWSNAEITSFIDDYPIIRPVNFYAGLPGRGSAIIEKNGMLLGVINAEGRVYMDPCDNPFTAVAEEIDTIRNETPCIIVDFHAEASAEKCAMAYYTDGKVSAVIGTHTHVQTADERILPGGTAFITDAGMTGPTDGVIGMDRRKVTDKFVRSFPVKFEPAAGKAELRGVVVEIDNNTGKALSIERIVCN